MSEWQPIETAPIDGTRVWCWLYDSGIVLMRWMTAEENADEAGYPEQADEFISCWVKANDPEDGEWKPKFWMPYEAVAVPPGVVWVHDAHTGHWRDEAKAHSAVDHG